MGKTEIPMLIRLKSGVFINFKGFETNCFLDNIMIFRIGKDTIYIQYWNGARLESREIKLKDITEVAIVAGNLYSPIFGSNSEFNENKQFPEEEEIINPLED